MSQLPKPLLSRHLPCPERSFFLVGPRGIGKSTWLKQVLPGALPMVQWDRAQAAEILSAYVSTYLAEEIRVEGLIRNIAPFVRFLGIAGLLNGQAVNGQNIAREAALPRATVDTYFAILTDTLVGHFLPAWRPGAKVREAAHPKFYWFDPGVARGAAGLLRDPVERAWLACALETLIFHELRVYNEVSRKFRPLAYYRTPAGVEIDFIIESRKRQSGRPPRVVAIEVKLANKWDRTWERPLRELASAPSIQVERCLGVYLGQRSYRFDSVEVLPVETFFRALHRGELF